MCCILVRCYCVYFSHPVNKVNSIVWILKEINYVEGFVETSTKLRYRYREREKERDWEREWRKKESKTHDETHIKATTLISFSLNKQKKRRNNNKKNRDKKRVPHQIWWNTIIKRFHCRLINNNNQKNIGNNIEKKGNNSKIFE